MSGCVEVGVGDHRVGTTGLADAVVGVVGLDLRDRDGEADRDRHERDPAEDRSPGVLGAPARRLHRYCSQWVAHGRLSWVRSGLAGCFQPRITDGVRQGRRDPDRGGACTTARGPVRPERMVGEHRRRPLGRFRLTAYAVAQLVPLLRADRTARAVARRRHAGRGLGRDRHPGSRRAGDPVDREPAPDDGRRGCSAARCRCPYRPLPRGTGFLAKARVVLADPMTWRDLAWLVVAPVVGLAVSLTVILLLVLVVTGVHLVVRDAAADAGPSRRSTGSSSSYSRTETLEQRVQVLAETRADAGRPLGGRAAPARARPARRRPGPAGRPVDEPRAWPRRRSTARTRNRPDS